MYVCMFVFMYLYVTISIQQAKVEMYVCMYACMCVCSILSVQNGIAILRNIYRIYLGDKEWCGTSDAAHTMHRARSGTPIRIEFSQDPL